MLCEITEVDFPWNVIALAGHTFSQGREQSAGQSSGSNSVQKTLIQHSLIASM